MKSNVNVLLFFLFGIGSPFYGQMSSYDYCREMTGINDQWHRIELPHELFDKVKQEMSDIRIFGITEDQDTIEAPYIHKIRATQRTQTSTSFKIINETKNNKGYYYTFEIPEKGTINQIELSFKNLNFDWSINLEASQDQKEWFTIVERYRMVAIKNDLTDYKFTTINFNDAKYAYYRVLIESTETSPELTTAKIAKVHTKKGTYITYPVASKRIREIKKRKQTELVVDLEKPSRISFIRMNPTDRFDFYRPFSIQYVSDSVQTEKGWKYQYQSLVRGVLNSLEANEFSFPEKTVQKLKIIVDNGDNEPLTIGDIQVKGYKHELIARFTKPANYFLTYGNPKARKAQYDIGKFTNSIPEAPGLITLENEQKIDKTMPKTVAPLFENKGWLWAIMGLIILLLGGFSFKMLRTKQE